MVRLMIMVLVTSCIVAASGTCSKDSQKKKDGVVVNINRHMNAKVNGKLNFGPNEHRKSNVDVNLKDYGDTNVEGNLFETLKTAGRLAEILKIVGSRFKPETKCPPRLPCKDDTSKEGIIEGYKVKRRSNHHNKGRQTRRNNGKNLRRKKLRNVHKLNRKLKNRGNNRRRTGCRKNKQHQNPHRRY